MGLMSARSCDHTEKLNGVMSLAFSDRKEQEQHGAEVQEECRAAEVEAAEPGDVPATMGVIT